MAFPIDATDSLLRAGHENARRCATSLRVAVPKERRDGSDIASIGYRLTRDEMTHRVQADALRLDAGCLGDSTAVRFVLVTCITNLKRPLAHVTRYDRSEGSAIRGPYLQGCACIIRACDLSSQSRRVELRSGSPEAVGIGRTPGEASLQTELLWLDEHSVGVPRRIDEEANHVEGVVDAINRSRSLALGIVD